MLGSQTEVAKLTYEDYRQLPDDGKRYEIIEGDLYVTPSPSTRHQRIVRRLLRVLDDFVESRELGEVFTAPLDVVLSEHNVVQPDLVFVSTESRNKVHPEAIRGAPDLVVEIVSQTTGDRDRNLKRRLYLREGVREYWIVDPDERSLTIVRPEGEQKYLGGPVVLKNSLLAGLKLDLDELFG